MGHQRNIAEQARQGGDYSLGLKGGLHGAGRRLFNVDPRYDSKNSSIIDMPNDGAIRLAQQLD